MNLRYAMRSLGVVWFGTVLGLYGFWFVGAVSNVSHGAVAQGKQAGPGKAGYGEQRLGAVGDKVYAVTRATGPDGCHRAWMEPRGEGVVFVNDGQSSPPYDEILKPGPIFSADARRIAYAARKGAGWLVVVDGEP